MIFASHPVKWFRKVHVQATYGSLWISFGLGNTSTIMHAGTVRAWEYPYDQSCRARVGPNTPVTVSSCYSYQVKPDYVRALFDPEGQLGLRTIAYGPSYRNKIAGRPYMKIKNAQLSATGNTAAVRVQIYLVHRAGLHGMPSLWLPTGSHGFGHYGAPNCPRASCDLGIKHLMLKGYMRPRVVSSS